MPYPLRYFILLLTFTLFSIPVFSQSLREVVAKPGDGIYLLLKRHGLNPTSHIKAFQELNQKNLGAGNSLYAGRTYLLPETSATSGTKAAAAVANASPSVLKVPLFGPKYERVEIVNQQLKGAVFYLVAGHSGPDPGAIGKYGPYQLSEDEYAYDVTIRLARRLMERGATVYMIIQDPDDGIRDENVLKMDRDEVGYFGKPVPYVHKLRLRQRVQDINQLAQKHRGAYQRMLSVHIDSRSKGQNIDVFFYHHENSPAGKALAERIHQVFDTKYNRYQPNREYFGSVTPRSSLYVVKYSNPPTVFVELGNIKNDKDQRRFVIPNNRQALANWITDGIITDYKATK
ncbi:N-acetylmuramoyl-L-alanine amidase family protein [Pontibacter akesuensis]|uniref:N-acetylmuramoyl-L-alanine amidase n=1 Tax=Pontibacter akesuensis TaxID=388950 RepID=A0A1I7G195_9BACT|nr:N-acetylmuramoyl-L-alanine amidase [Pontibacter akesuensis]GHA59449.1 N-acetylmuramoyl-L-alanine amidase [Pontibacter akesuensis]SFU42081.1 N-acetylmuramoyl-L-alanine amidase [Pontibacter akesuensis]